MGRLVTLTALILGMGCDNAPEEIITIPERPNEPEEPETDTVETDPPPQSLGSLTPDLWAIQALFAYEEEYSEFVRYAVPDVGLVPMELVVTLIEGVTLRSCSVRLQFADRQTNASWVLDRVAWAGTDVPDDATVVDDCELYRLPHQYDGGVGFHVSKWDWSFGVGPIDSDLAEALRQAWGPAQWGAREPSLLGAIFYAPFFAGSSLSEDGFVDGWGIGYEVDGNLQIDTDGAGGFIPIDRSIVNAPGGIATGYYQMDLIIDNPLILTAEPPGQ